MESRLEVGGPVSDRRELSGERGVGHDAQVEHHQVHVAWRRDLEDVLQNQEAKVLRCC